VRWGDAIPAPRWTSGDKLQQESIIILTQSNKEHEVIVLKNEVLELVVIILIV
jgi:hypothetical protein